MKRSYDSIIPLGRLARLLVLVLLVSAYAIPANAQSGSVAGIVIDASDGLPLAGANVLIIGSNGVMVSGSATTEDGRYTVSSLPSGAYTLRARFLGFQEYETGITITGGQALTVDVTLTEGGFELNTVVITGSRRQEKVLEAPSSISVLTAADVAENIGTSSIEALRNTTGVDIAQTGVDRREVVLRGFNNAFSGASYVLTDYRHAAVASLAVNIYSIMPNINIDVDRIEVVRGPGSALYGAGVDSGVIHFISKDPFSHPGTTVSLAGGERSFMSVQVRHAGVVGAGKNIGYKFTGAYGQADDWTMNPLDPIDALQLDGDVIPRKTDYDKFNVNGSVEYRFAEKGSVIAGAGHAELTATVLSGIGTLQAIGFGYSYAQLRVQYDRFFAQAYMNFNNAGESFVYDQDFNSDGVADIVVDKGIQYTVQAQYNADLGPRQALIGGVDLELTRPDTEGTILGRNEENDSISEVGAYLQSTTNVTPKLDLTVALRGDLNNITEKLQFSPRAAVVFKASKAHSVRVTYNRAFSSPSTNSNFLDIIAATTSAFNVRGRGSAGGFTWDRNAAYGTMTGGYTDLVATSFLPNRLGQQHAVGAELDAIYELVYAGLVAMPSADVAAALVAQGVLVNAAVVDQLKALLNPAVTPVTGFSTGLMFIPNLTTGAIERTVSDIVEVKRLAPTVTNTFEVGYKGLVGDRLLFTLDGYYTNKRNFVGPLLIESPLVATPGLQADLTAALSTGITGNAQLAGALASFGLSPAQAAALVVGLAADDLPAAVAIVAPVENATGAGMAPELMLTYRNFGEVNYYGIDAAFEFLATDELSVFGNVSFVSDNLFDADELAEPGSGLSLALNASAMKGRLGAKYRTPSGISVNAAGRYTDGFPIRSGPYVGDLPSYFVLDLGVGYEFGSAVPGLRLDVGVSNALDEVHREFIGAPNMGRMGVLRATYSIQ